MQSPAQALPEKTPQAYNSTPMYGYTSSPAYGGASSGYGDAAYSPGGGASQHSGYSPTGLMLAHQSPSYSPTTPNYGQTNTPIQHNTNTYKYGSNAPGGVPAYTMPNVSSPSRSPAINSSSPQASGPNPSYASYGGQSTYVASPSYAMAINRQAGTTAQTGTRPTAGTAYDPEAGAKNSDSSESDGDDK